MSTARTEPDWIEAVGLAVGVVRWASTLLGLDPGLDLEGLIPGERKEK
jgi:hypothetical protein